MCYSGIYFFSFFFFVLLLLFVFRKNMPKSFKAELFVLNIVMQFFLSVAGEASIGCMQPVLSDVENQCNSSSRLNRFGDNG